MKPKFDVSPCPEQELTIAKLRTYSGFENYTDDEATEAIQFIKRMSQVLLSLYRQNDMPGKS